MESKRILNELKAEYEKYASMVKESKENMRMLRENKEMSIRQQDEFDMMKIQYNFRDENFKSFAIKQKLLDSYNDHNSKKDLSTDELKALRAQYKHLHESYVKTLKLQKQLIKEKEREQKENLEDTINRIMIKHEVNEKLFSLCRKRDRAKEALDNHKRKMAEDRCVKYVSKAKMEAPTEDVCSICYDNHATKDTIVTRCKHQFGFHCYQQWVRSCVFQGRDTCCPMCKKDSPSLFRFSEKEAPIRKPTTAAKKPTRGKGAIGDAVYLLALSKARTQVEEIV